MINFAGVSVYITGPADALRDAADVAFMLSGEGAHVTVASPPHDTDVDDLVESASEDLDRLLAADLVVLLRGSREANLPEVCIAECAGIPTVGVEEILRVA